MGKNNERTDKDNKGKGQSRRDFVKTAAIGAAAAAAAVTTGKAGIANAQQGAPAMRVPEDFKYSLSLAAKKFEFPTTGAKLFANVCKEEGLGHLFCCPGNYTIVHALADAGIPTIGGRHEGNMANAADGFARVTGKIAACSGTEGPGFINMVPGVATAFAARSPVLVLASNMRIRDEDAEGGIQLSQPYQQQQTWGIKKYGKRITNPARLYEYAGYAFRQLKSGVPQPVHLDFPSEVAGAKIKSPKEQIRYFDQAKYRTESPAYPSPKNVQAAVELIKKAKRPMIVASTGVFYHKAMEILQKFAEKTQIPVAESGPMRGKFSDDHQLSASRSPYVLPSVDLVILVGQYCMPTQ